MADNGGELLDALMNVARKNSTNSSTSRFVDIAPRLARTMLGRHVSPVMAAEALVYIESSTLEEEYSKL